MGEALAILQPLKSLLHVSEDSGMASTFHASFPDFMFDRERSKQFYCDEDQHRYYLASRCFEIMKAQLRFNICNLETSYLPDSEVADLETRISQNISPDLEFACQNWEYYLQMSTPSKSLYDMLDDFLSNSLLFWMEVLNLKNHISLARSDLFGVGEWLRATEESLPLIEFVADACRFIDYFRPWLISTPHLYISALSLYYRSTPISMHYMARFRGFIKIETIEEQPEPVTAGLDIKGSWPSAQVLTYSDDGSCIGCIFDNGTLIVCNALDGSIINSRFVPLHEGLSPMAGFSSDCRSAVFINFPRVEIYLWEASKFKHIFIIGAWPRYGPRNDFLPRNDFWDHKAITPLPGGTGYAGFSHTEIFIYEYGKEPLQKLLPLHRSREESFKGYSQPLIKSSPEGSRLIITHYSGEVFEWKVEGGRSVQCLLGPLSTDQTTRLSQNCKFAVRGPWGGNYQIWDVEKNKRCSSFHPPSTLSIVQISSDGTLVVMEDGLSHQVWDIQTGKLVGSLNDVKNCCLSPDGTQVAYQDRLGIIHTRSMMFLNHGSQSRTIFLQRFCDSRLINCPDHGVFSFYLSEKCVIHFSSTQTEFKLHDSLHPS